MRYRYHQGSFGCPFLATALKLWLPSATVLEVDDFRRKPKIYQLCGATYCQPCRSVFRTLGLEPLGAGSYTLRDITGVIKKFTIIREQTKQTNVSNQAIG